MLSDKDLTRLIRRYFRRGGLVHIYRSGYCKGALRLDGIIGRRTIGYVIK